MNPSSQPYFSKGAPGRPLTSEQQAKGGTPAARKKALRTRMARNAITWLRRQVEQSRLPEEVKARTDKLFQSLGTPMQLYRMDEDTAQREAFRISARIHWLRSTHRMLAMDPSDTGFLNVSKTAAQWTQIDVKLNSGKGKADSGRSGRAGRVPPPTRQPVNAQNVPPAADGETA